jgi:hypothetical protein
MRAFNAAIWARIVVVDVAEPRAADGNGDCGGATLAQAHLLEGGGIELHVSRAHDRLPPRVPVQLENAATAERAHAALAAAQIDGDVGALVPRSAPEHEIPVDVHGEAARCAPHDELP